MKYHLVSVDEAFNACGNAEAYILDVRTAAECVQGVAKGAICLELNDIKQKALSQLSKNKTYYVMCLSGKRSQQAIEILMQLGFVNLKHIDQGYQQWQIKGLPIEKTNINQHDIRYNRHHQLQGFGRKGQEKLSAAHVLMIGAGGLGSSAALYLAAAGIGQLTIIDDDKVELSNLQRQIIHSTNSIGTHKVESASQQLQALNPDIKINTLVARLDESNANELIRNSDLVIDGSDNLTTRYLVNDICLKYKKPLVYAAVYQYEAQISVFTFNENQSPCLRCLFPKATGFEPENCSTVGVLGVVPGLAGIIQASEAIKIIANVGQVLDSQLLICDLLDNSFRTIKYKYNSDCSFH